MYVKTYCLPQRVAGRERPEDVMADIGGTTSLTLTLISISIGTRARGQILPPAVPQGLKEWLEVEMMNHVQGRNFPLGFKPNACLFAAWTTYNAVSSL